MIFPQGFGLRGLFRMRVRNNKFMDLFCVAFAQKSNDSQQLLTLQAPAIAS